MPNTGRSWLNLGVLFLPRNIWLSSPALHFIVYLTIIRYSSTEESTLGTLLLNGNFACYTLEDPYQSKKIHGVTRIPGGIYTVGLQQSGALHDAYKIKFPSLHKGMLNIQDVPGFQGVMLHIGNSAVNTSGCILVGDEANNNTLREGYLRNSSNAYERTYPLVAEAIEACERVQLLIGIPEELIKFHAFTEIRRV